MTEHNANRSDDGQVELDNNMLTQFHDEPVQSGA